MEQVQQLVYPVSRYIHIQSHPNNYGVVWQSCLIGVDYLLSVQKDSYICQYYTYLLIYMNVQVYQKQKIRR